VSNATNWTALHSTAAVGNHELVQELIQQGSVVEARSHHGQTPLHLAAHSGSLECCSLLVAAGADLNAQTFFEKNTRKLVYYAECIRMHVSMCLCVCLDVGVLCMCLCVCVYNMYMYIYLAQCLCVCVSVYVSVCSTLNTEQNVQCSQS
jgi:hypothetical protein